MPHPDDFDTDDEEEVKTSSPESSRKRRRCDVWPEETTPNKRTVNVDQTEYSESADDTNHVAKLNLN